MLIPRKHLKKWSNSDPSTNCFSVFLKQIVIQTLTIQTEFQPSEGGYMYDCLLKTKLYFKKA